MKGGFHKKLQLSKIHFLTFLTGKSDLCYDFKGALNSLLDDFGQVSFLMCRVGIMATSQDCLEDQFRMMHIQYLAQCLTHSKCSLNGQSF